MTAASSIITHQYVLVGSATLSNECNGIKSQFPSKYRGVIVTQNGNTVKYFKIVHKKGFLSKCTYFSTLL